MALRFPAGPGWLLLMLTLGLACSSTPSILTAERTRHAAQTAQVIPTSTVVPTRAPASPATRPAAKTAVPTAYRAGPHGFPADVDPLTGLQVESPALLDRRPVALEFANFPVEIRPQSGLSQADLVFEHAVGEGTTRLLAFYYGRNAARAGPIASGQWVDGELVRLYGGVLGVNGAIPEIDRILQSQLPGRKFNAAPALCPGLCPEPRGSASPAFADTAALSRYVSGLTNGGTRPDLDGYVFDANVRSGGAPAEALQVAYAHINQVAWQFDPEGGVYLRSQDRADGRPVPSTDALTGEPLGFQNVIVLFATHRAVRANLLDIRLWHEPSRPLLLLRSGQLYRGRWSTTGQDAPLAWSDADGLPLALAPGATWVEIVSLPSEISQPEPGRWQVDFAP